MTIRPEAGALGSRLDRYLARVLKDVSRSRIKEYVEEGRVLVNGKKSKPAHILEAGDEISVGEFPREESRLAGEDIPLEVIYEDEDVIVVNKPAGLVTHPGAGNREHTLANALAFHSKSLSRAGGEYRPGIVQRLDKMTSGLLVAAKNDAAHRYLAAQLKRRTFVRKYLALVVGEIGEEEGKIIAPLSRDKRNRLKMAVDPINGKDAVTRFRVLERFPGYTLLECELVSGRTHQIRVHLDYIGHPVVGDPLYGRNNKALYSKGQLLHAHEIAFVHPRSRKTLRFTHDVPEDFRNVLTTLRSKKSGN